jgi:hypothetical protein
MLDIEDKISNFVQQQFPAFYQEEGPIFIAFMRAYYEWLEKPTQTLILEDNNAFAEGDTVTQALTTSTTAEGIVLLVEADYIVVKLTTNEHFVSKSMSGFLQAIYNQDEVSTNIISITSDNILAEARSIQKYRDIDATIDIFILHYKEKYLKNIQFDIRTNKKLLIKNSLDLYRAKGTDRATDLFFKLIYAEPAEVYYPGDDLFRLSDNTWVVPQYIEVTSSPKTVGLVGKLITGVTSGATAFVEKYIKQRNNTGISHLLYLTDIQGEFVVDELLSYDTVTKDLPKVLGSISEAYIINGGTGHSVGDEITLEGNRGTGAVAVVTEIANNDGLIQFSIADGGYGFTVNAETLVSELVIEMANVITTGSLYYDILETIEQPLANIVYTQATANIVVGDYVYQYGPSLWSGSIVSLTTFEGSSNGSFIVSVHDNVSFNTALDVFTSGNAVQCNVSSYTEVTATGTYLGNYDKKILFVSNSNIDFTALPTIYQSDTSGEYASGKVFKYTPLGSTYRVELSNTAGTFKAQSSDLIRVRGTSKTAYLDSITITVGLHNVSNTFYAYDSAISTSDTLATTGYVTKLSTGTSGSFNVGALTNTEEVELYTDLLSSNNAGYANEIGGAVVSAPFMNIRLNSFGYGFPSSPQGNSATALGTLLNTDLKTIGTISSLINVNPGSNNTFEPIVLVREQLVSNYDKNDYILYLTSGNKKFIVGESVEQGDAKGVIKSIGNTSVLYVKRLNFENLFTASSTITGVTSGASSVIAEVAEDESTLPIGLNATILGDIVSGEGSIKTAKIIDTGIGYRSGDTITFGTEQGSGDIGVTPIGYSPGYFKYTKGFLSNDKYILDSDYYQEYSYDIISKLPFDKYADMFKKVMHVAGTKMFGSVSVTYEADSDTGLVLGETNTTDVNFFASYYGFFNGNTDVIVTSTSDYVGETISFDITPIVGDYSYEVLEANITPIVLSYGYESTEYGIQVDGHYIEIENDDGTGVKIFSDGDPVIYVASDPVLTFFANAIVSNFISINNNILSNSSLIVYSNESGQADIGGLSDGSEYYCVYANNSGTKLSLTAGGANISLTAGLGVHTLIGIANIESSVVKLANNTTYYISRSTPTSVKLSTNPRTDLVVEFNANSDIFGGKITMSNHPFSANDWVQYYVDIGKTPLAELTSGQYYYVSNTTSTTITLSESSTASPLALTKGLTETGHYVSTDAFIPIEPALANAIVANNHYIYIE